MGWVPAEATIDCMILDSPSTGEGKLVLSDLPESFLATQGELALRFDLTNR